MECLRCRHESTPGQKFCGECGALLAAVCRSCGASNPPAQKFCGECGGALGAPPPVDPEDAVAGLEIIAAAQRSAAEHGTVALPMGR